MLKQAMSLLLGGILLVAPAQASPTEQASTLKKQASLKKRSAPTKQASLMEQAFPITKQASLMELAPLPLEPISPPTAQASPSAEQASPSAEQSSSPADPVIAGSQPKAAEAEGPQPVSTDGPTISRSSHVVGRGEVVFEANYSFCSTRDGNANLHTTPLILRHGVSDEIELRLESNGLCWQDIDRGYADVGLGVRYEFEPSWAVDVILMVPVGSSAFRSEGVVPFVGLAHDQTLGELDSLGFNAGLTFKSGGQTESIFTMVYSRMVSEDVSWFGEIAVIGADVRVDTGLQIWTSPNFVINLAVLRGLSGGGQDWGGSVGFGARF